MKRIRLAIIILVLALAAGLLLWKNINHTGSFGQKDFAIEKPERIDKIFFAPNNNSKAYLLFEKDKNGIWWVKNDTRRYKADTSSVNDLLFYVMRGLLVKNPVNDAALDGVNRDMALNAVKAQFYVGDHLIKTIYVGGPTYDQYGTYMYLPGEGESAKHDRPCVVEVRGHNGYLTPYFNADINNWRSQVILDVPSKNIKVLSIIWPEDPAQSFAIENRETGPVLKDGRGKQLDANTNKLLAYLDMFTFITREGGEIAGINKNKAAKDTLLHSAPFFIIDILTTEGKHEVLNLYHRKVSEETYSPETRTGDLKIYETETYWGILAGTDEIWVMQDGIMKNRMRKLSAFLK